MTRTLSSLRRALPAALALAAFASAPSQAGPKKYFLTLELVIARNAPDACGKGYHMASLWEIFDPTLLKYDTKRGQASDDSASGPPAGPSGWIRTGAGSSSSSTPGTGNCNGWLSLVPLDYGTSAALDTDWGGGSIAASPWTAFTFPCDTLLPVWCRQN